MLDEKNAIKEAREIIGEGAWDDYIIAPTKHAAELEAKAPDLARILSSSEVDTVAHQYEERDRRSIEAQKIFKENVSRINATVFISSLIGTVLMASAILGKNLDSVMFNIWLIFLGIISVVFGGLGKMWMSRVRGSRLLERWMEQRASAETYRLRFFELVIRPQEVTKDTSGILLSLLQLQYFVRYQLEVQIAYYLNRGKDHRSAADKTIRMAGMAMFLGSLGAGLGGVLGGVFKPDMVIIAALGVVGASLASYAVNIEAVNQDRRNVERYGRTLETLQKLRERLDDVRKAMVASRHEVLEMFVASVHDQLSLEHRQWISAASDISQTLSKLEKALADSR